MSDLVSKHGEKEGKSIFYATANARHGKPGEKVTGKKSTGRGRAAFAKRKK